MTHDPLCKGGDCTCTCDELQEGHRGGIPSEIVYLKNVY